MQGEAAREEISGDLALPGEKPLGFGTKVRLT